MPKTMLAMPIRINAGRHPGASDELTIGRPFGVEGSTVTGSSSYEITPACLRSSNKVIAQRQLAVKSATVLFVSADPPDDRGAKPGCDS